jgi:RNA polymerase sigma-70 factor (ECF subfamily)
VHDVNSTMPHRRDPLAASGPETAESIETIYDRYAPQVERWARRLAGPQFDAEDLLHDIFLVVMRSWPEFRGEAKITTWLFRITQQVVRWRRRNDALRRWLWGRHGQDTQDTINARTSVPTPVEEIERREQNLRLYAALDQLPEKYRTTLVLFALEGMSGEQIAELTDSEVGAVWVRLHRARAKLADLLIDEVDEEKMKS